MRRLVLALVSISVGGCQCFYAVDEAFDAGAADASVTVSDASISDAGSSDASVASTDASISGAGSSDASVASTDASVSDAGSSDASQADASIDAGTPDASIGGGDAGSPDASILTETCNGIDDDRRLDRPAPRRRLARTDLPTDSRGVRKHPLVLPRRGVTGCNYGPDYEVAERRCDGLDNDCDGRVDKSWPHTILEGDGGMTTEQVHDIQALGIASGTIVTIPDEVLWLDQGLNVTNDVQFEAHPLGGRSMLIPAPDGWTRISVTYPSHTEAVLGVHQLWADGGYDHDVDGGVRFIARDVGPGRGGPYSWMFAAVAVDDGWRMVSN